MNDVYQGISTKNCSRDDKEENLRQECICKVLEQKMLSNKEWLAFFRNIKIKQHLLSLYETYLCADDFL